MGIKINNLPNFEDPNKEKKNLPNDAFVMSKEFYEEVNKTLPLTPSFPRGVQITRIMCDVEAKRILTNLAKMNDNDILIHCDKDLLNRVIQSFGLTYKISDLNFLPENEKTTLIPKIIKVVKDYYKDNMNGETLYNATKMQGLMPDLAYDEELLNMDLDIDDVDFAELNESLNKLFDVRSDINSQSKEELMTDLLIMSGASKEFAEEFLNDMIDPDSFQDFTKMQFLEAVESDKYIQTLYKIEHHFYGEHILGKDCKHPNDFNLNNKIIVVSFVEINEQSGDVVFQIFDENDELLDYEELLELYGKTFTNWLDRWQILVDADTFIFQYKYKNILDEQKTDPISDLATKNINIVYKSNWFDISVRNDMLNEHESFVSEMQNILNDISNLRENTSDSEDEQNPLFNILNQIKPPKNRELTTAVVQSSTNNVGTNDLMLLGEDVSSIAYTSQAHIGNTLKFQFENEFKSIADIFNKVKIVNPSGTEETGFPFLQDQIKEVKIVQDHVNYLLAECIFDLSKMENITKINPLYSIIIKHKDQFVMFFPKYGNTFCINKETNKLYLDYQPNLEGVLAHAELMLYNDKEHPFTLKTLGLFKNYISEERFDKDGVCYYRLGKLFFNNSKSANDFKALNDIKSNQIPIYIKIKSTDDSEAQNFIRYVFAKELCKSQTIQNARIMYNNRAYIEVDWNCLFNFISTYED